MKIEFLKKIIWSQLGASVKMLENAIASCPDDLWSDDSLAKPYWTQVYHALFFLDLYLSESPTLMNPPSKFRPLERGPKGPVPQKAYSRQELMEYLEYGRARRPEQPLMRLLRKLSPKNVDSAGWESASRNCSSTI